MKILITGGCGYIGSHVAISLSQAGHVIKIIDNFSNSSKNIINEINSITQKKIDVIECDIRDQRHISKILDSTEIDAVFHFAGLKSVSESVNHPLKYYENNVSGSISLFNEILKTKIKKIIFSSSATVYSNQNKPPFNENHILSYNSHPYGQSKVIIEKVLHDMCKSDSHMSVGILRYFNPIGAHESGRIGDRPNNIPNNLIPYIIKVLEGKLPTLYIYGNDYDTKDGSGVRDYIHINDLTEGHIKAFKKINGKSGYNVWNLGSGTGYSVFEVIELFEELTGEKIPHQVVARRKGDVAVSLADPSKAMQELNWSPQENLRSMIKDSLKTISK